MTSTPSKSKEINKAALRSDAASRPLCEKLICEQILARSNYLQSIEVFASIESTSSYLNAQPINIGQAKVCLAEAQLSGRGRRGNSWQSDPNKNIMLSLSWGFAEWPETITGLGLAVALVIAERLNLEFKLGVAIKWPNDLLIDDQKLAGVLVDVVGSSDGACKVVIGLGLNVDQASWTKLDDSERQSDYVWTDLVTHGVDADRNTLAAFIIGDLIGMLTQFEEYGFSKFVQRWNALSCHTDKQVILSEVETREKIVGRMIGVNDTGELIIQPDDGPQTLVSNSSLSLRLVS